MDVEKTIEFLLDNQARHDARIAQLQEQQRQIQEQQRQSQEQHRVEIAEIRTIQKATQEMLSETVRLVGNPYQIAERHQSRIETLEQGRA